MQAEEAAHMLYTDLASTERHQEGPWDLRSQTDKQTWRATQPDRDLGLPN